MKRNIYLIMLFLSLAGFRISGTRTISGTVYESYNLPLPGVAVQIKGSSNKTQTDKSGHYSITLNEGQTELIFTYVGFDRKEVKIGKSDILNVQLQPSSGTLDEIVVVGYGAAAQKKTTYAQSNIYAPVPLQGRVAGVQVSKRNRTEIMIATDPNTESYKGIAENRFNDPKTTPLSTFAVDVDAASYSNVRRYINNGSLPPKDAVRIEEMINYFHYDLAGPANTDPVAIHTELSSAPWNPAHRLLRIGLKAKSVNTDKLPASNFVFLIDVSGSMFSYNKLPLVQASMKLLVDQLRETDHVAIVTYAGNAGLALPSTPGNQKTKIKEAIDALAAGGSTAGGAGIRLAYKIAQENFVKKGNNRMVLATDGDFNVGASSDDDMEKIITTERQSGISISVLGFGMGNLKDSKMETIADKGHGNYAYIDNISEARKAIVTEFGGTLFAVAKDVKLQIEFNPSKVQAYRLLGYENRLMAKEDFNNDQKIGGDMGVGHTVTALYEIIPAGVHDNFTDSVDPLKYQKTKENPVSNSSEMVTIKFRYKSPDGDKSKMEKVSIMDQPVALMKTSADFRFASAVAELGLILRDSEFKQHADYSSLITRAKSAKGKDEEGYRTEFITLAESAKLLSKSGQESK